MRPSAIRTLGEQLAAKPAPRGAFVVIEPKFSMPSSEERGELVRVIRPFSAVPTAVVFERDGFLSAAVRAAVTGLSLLLGTTHPRIFQSIGAATGWMAGALTEGIGAAELESTIRSTRSARAAQCSPAEALPPVSRPRRRPRVSGPRKIRDCSRVTRQGNRLRSRRICSRCSRSPRYRSSSCSQGSARRATADPSRRTA
jgi:hypothetical protein